MNMATTELLSELKALVQENTILKAQVNHYQQQRQAFNQNITHTMQKIAAQQQSLQQRNVLLQAEQQKLAQQRETFIKQFQAAKTIIAEQKLQLETEKAQLGEQKETYKHLQLEMQTLQAHYQQQAEEFAQQQKAWSDSMTLLEQKYFEQKETARKQYDEQIQELQKTLSQYHQNIDVARSAHLTITEDYEAKCAQLIDLTKQIEQAHVKLNEIEQLLADQKSTLAQYHEDIQMAREQQENITQDYEEKYLQFIDLKNELNQIQIDKNVAHEELAQIKKSILEQKIFLQQYQNEAQAKTVRQPENMTEISNKEDEKATVDNSQPTNLSSEIFVSSRQMTLHHHNHAHKSHTPFSEWLSLFLLKRNFIPDGRVLCRYFMNEQEYTDLCGLFSKNHRVMQPSDAHYQEWCACYCLAASEIYRREYSGGSWHWDLIDQTLKVSFKQPNDRYAIIEKGMKYWKREIQKRESNGNHQYLGTLFAECGLPVQLLTAENNKFSRLVAYGLTKYAESQQTYCPLTQYLQDKKNDLPEVFRNNETTIELLTETVHVLMDLAQNFDLSNKPEPVVYLDKHATHWRQRFPFVLPEQQADDLIHHWLSDAAKEQSHSAKQQFSCTHFVETDKWQLMADFRLPETFAFTVPTHYSGRTVLQWALFEGESPVAQVGGTIFATLKDNILSFKFPTQHVSIVRQQPDFPLSVRFFVDGQWLFTQMLPETQMDMQLPCVFIETTEQKWKLVANANYIRINSEAYLLRLPQDFKLPENKNTDIIQQDDDNVIWLKAYGNLNISHVDGHDIYIVIAQNTGQAVSLSGKFFYRLQLADGSGAPIYRGFPNIHTPDDLPCTHIRIQGKDFLPKNVTHYGTFQAAFYSNDICLLRRKITVLPNNFSLHWDAIAKENQAAKLSLRLPESAFCQVHGENLAIEQQDSSFTLQTVNGDCPAYIVARIGSSEHLAASLRIAFPFHGAYLSDDEGLVENKQLNLNQLMGKVVSLHTTQSQIQMQWTLQPENIQRTFTLPVNENSLQLHLYQLKAQLTQFLACSSNQDAKITLAFQAEHNVKAWLELEITHYNGVAQWDNQHYQYGQLLTLRSDKKYFIIKKQYDDEYPSPHAKVNIMRLDAPELGWQTLSANDLLGNHRYTVPSEIYGEGLWLIYPAEDSPIQFRPTIFDNSKMPFVAPEQIDSLSVAARLFHPKSNSQTISQVIAQMARQPEHEGWQYFVALQKHFSHLPLSVFETWKELARQPESLAMAVLRLGLNGAFCERIRQELAVVWEWQPENALRQAVAHFTPYYDKQLRDVGLDPQIYPLTMDSIPMSIVCHNEILRQQIFKGYLNTEMKQQFEENVHDILQTNKQEIAKSFYLSHYNMLRSFRLPETLCEPLQSWLDTQPKIGLSQCIRQLSKTRYDRATVWLPIFSAYVKANQSQPSDLMLSENHAQLLDAFYQVYSLDPDWFDYICANITSLLISE